MIDILRDWNGQSKVRLMYLEVLKEEERFGLFLLMLNDRQKSMTNAFCSYKLTKKLCVVYLEIKLQ